MADEPEDAVLEILKKLQAGQTELKAGQAEMKASQAEMKAGQAAMRGAVEAVEARMTTLEVELGDVKDMVHQLNRRQIRMENKIDDVHTTLKSAVNNLAERVAVLEEQ